MALSGYSKKRPILFTCSLLFLYTTYCDAQQFPGALSEYIAAAKQNSPLLNDYNNQVYALKLDSLKLKTNYGFVVSGEGAAAYAPSHNNWGYDNALSNGHPVTAVVKSTREFVSKKNLDTRLASFYLGMQQVQNQAKLGEMQLAKTITDLYTATYVSQELYRSTGDVLDILRQEDVVLKKLAQASVFKQTDYLTFKVTLQQNELALEQRQAEWYDNYASLNRAAGIIDTLPRQLPVPAPDTSAIVPFDESIYAQSYKADSLKLVNEARIIGYDYKPKINAYADAGYQSTLITQPYKNFGWSAGVTVSVPIYDGKKRQLSLRQNKIAMQTRERYQQFANTQYNQQIAQLRSQVEQYKKMIATANEQMRYAKTLIEANARQLPTGDVKMVDFILSITNYKTLLVGVIQYKATLFNLQSQLQYLIIQ